MRTIYLSIAFFTILLFASCTNDDDNNLNPVIPDNSVTLRLTLRNTINFLSAKSFGSAPLTTTGQTFEVNFKATAGTYLSFANMFAQSNDWFFATQPEGIKLWDNGTPTTGDISGLINVWDAGTEFDEDFLSNFPSTIYTAPNQSGPNTGPADDDNTVRNTQRDITNYLTASLSYDNVSSEFTLTIVKANREALHNPGFITPGILVVHTMPNALFTEGESVIENGMESLAEDGSPQAIYDWFHEEGSTGAPLRLAAAYSIFSPGVAYVHQGDQSPFFTRGQEAIVSSGLEELAEDGNADVAYNYLNSLENVTAVKSDTGVPPGQEISFEIEASPGDRLNYATMLVASNDWFISNNQQGIELFDQDGNLLSDFVLYKSYLFDSGTEFDQVVGLGDGQPMNGNNAVANDADTSVRRITDFEDVQFGKGLITSPAGVTQLNEERGGYNFIDVIVERIN